MSYKVSKKALREVKKALKDSGHETKKKRAVKRDVRAAARDAGLKGKKTTYIFEVGDLVIAPGVGVVILLECHHGGAYYRFISPQTGTLEWVHAAKLRHP